MDTVVHVFAIVGSAVGATWVLRGELSEIRVALSNLVERVVAVEHKVIKLEERRARRK